MTFYSSSHDRIKVEDIVVPKTKVKVFEISSTNKFEKNSNIENVDPSQMQQYVEDYKDYKEYLASKSTEWSIAIEHLENMKSSLKSNYE